MSMSYSTPRTRKYTSTIGNTEASSEASTEVSSTPEFEKKSNGDELDKRTKIKREKLATAIRSISSLPLPAATVKGFCVLLFPILQILLDENWYRYILGLVSVYSTLSIRELAACAHCSTHVVKRGRKEARQEELPSLTRQRRKGAGRKSVLERYPFLLKEIIEYISLRSYGPCTKEIKEYTAATLDSIQNFIYYKFKLKIARSTIRLILFEHGIILRTNKKLLYGNQMTETPEQKMTRHLQYEYLSLRWLHCLNDPTCLVLHEDVKKKEVLGNHAASGKSYSFKGKPVKTDDHDYYRPLNVKTLKGMDDLLDREEGKAIPMGLFDYKMNKAYVAVGISHDTAQFTQITLERFIGRMKKDHPKANKIIIFCDGGGSNDARSDIPKYYLTLASRHIGMPITVIHYPPYRSKFNKIERMVWAYVSKKFEREPLRNLRTVIELIRNTHTKDTATRKGLTIICELDTNFYKTGKKLTDKERSLIRVKYSGPTVNSAVHLSYTIDGTTLKDSDIPDEELLTVFQIKENIDLSNEQKAQLKEEKARRAALASARKAAKQAESSSPKVSKSTKRRKKNSSGGKAVPSASIPA